MKKFILVFLLCNLVILASSSKYYYQKPLYRIVLVNEYVRKYYIPSMYEKYVKDLCYKYSIPIWLFARLIQNESKWKQYIISKNKDDSIDKGIAQLNSNSLKYFEWKFNDGKEIDPFNWKLSLEIACKYLYYLYKQFGTWDLAVMAYNAGPGKVSKKNIPLKTIEYYNSIFYYTLQRKEIIYENTDSTNSSLPLFK